MALPNAQLAQSATPSRYHVPTGRNTDTGWQNKVFAADLASQATLVRFGTGDPARQDRPSSDGTWSGEAAGVVLGSMRYGPCRSADGGGRTRMRQRAKTGHSADGRREGEKPCWSGKGHRQEESKGPRVAPAE